MFSLITGFSELLFTNATEELSCSSSVSETYEITEDIMDEPRQQKKQCRRCNRKYDNCYFMSANSRKCFRCIEYPKRTMKREQERAKYFKMC